MGKALLVMYLNILHLGFSRFQVNTCSSWPASQRPYEKIFSRTQTAGKLLETDSVSSCELRHCSLRLRTVFEAQNVMSVYRKQLSVFLTVALSWDPFIMLVKLEMKYLEIMNVSFFYLFSPSLLKEVISWQKLFLRTDAPHSNLREMLTQRLFRQVISCIWLYHQGDKNVEGGNRTALLHHPQLKWHIAFLVNEKTENGCFKYALKFRHLWSPPLVPEI